MDEDDFADHGIAPKKLITTDKFRNDGVYIYLPIILLCFLSREK